MKHNIIYIVLLFVIAFAACKKDEPVPVSSLYTDALKVEPSYTTADISCNIISDATINEVMLEYSTDSTFAHHHEERMTKGDDNLYTVFLDSLIDNTTYYFRCRAINKVNSRTSGTSKFSTSEYKLADVRTDSVTQIDVSSAYIHATLLTRGTDKETIVGFYFSSQPKVTEEDSCIMVALEGQEDSITYSYSLFNLEEGARYYVRAFAKNNVGITLGEELSFITTEMFPPSIGETTIAYVSYTNALCKSEVISDGGGTIIERGFCYSTTLNPTIENSKVNSGTGVGTFSSNITGLENGTKYFIRAYAKNCKGIVYGEQKSFTTNKYSVPVVVTSNVTIIKFTSAACSGSVTADGGQPVTERGICYSANPNPTILESKVVSGRGIGDFSCTLTNLVEGTSYYIRAYAVNSIGISYGEEIYFTTLEHLPNAIYYTASEKLNETADNTQGGLHIYRFDVSIVSHKFDDGEGEIIFSDLISTIGDYAFYNSSGLTSLTLPNSVTNIGSYAFSKCTNLKAVEIPNGVTNIGNYAFAENSNLLSALIPNSVTNIGEYAFSNCTKLNSINLPDKLKTLNSHVFNQCQSLTTIDIPTSVSNIGKYAFNECSNLTAVIIPTSVTRIGDGAFCECSSLNSIEFPDGLTEIKGYTCYKCIGLRSLIIPNSVTLIRSRAFEGCSSMQSVKCYAIKPPAFYSGGEFNGISRATLLYVPASSIDAYKAATLWKEFYNIFPISE